MKKNFIFVVMSLLVMSACGEKKNFDVLNGEWDVLSVGELAIPDSVEAFLGFNITEHLVYGSTGCNQLTGALPVEVNPEVPMFAAMGSTRRMCADMTVEDALLPALGQVVNFKVEGNQLQLIDGVGKVVVVLQKR